MGAANTPLVARNLKKAFGMLEVVSGFDHELAPGIVTGLVGPNGAGKTTIFNMLSGVLAPDSGEVLLEGKVITGKPLFVASRLGLGRSFQEIRLFPSLSCLDNCILYAQSVSSSSLVHTVFLPRSTRRQAASARQRSREALAFVGLESQADVLAGSLSYAEQKLLAIARLMSLGARTLLLDEPASGLDRRGVETLLEVVHRLVDGGRTVLLIEHNLDVVRDSCQVVLFLDRGTILAAGSPDEVFARPELAEVYFSA